jgi:subtilase family serine protease
MFKSVRVLLCFSFAVGTSLSFAAGPDRIAGALTGGQKVALRGNVNGYVRAENDLGRADGNRPMHGITLTFRPSDAQQKDLDQFLSELGDRSSPNYHKYLTPKQFGQRFGMSWNDLNKVIAWVQSEGFTNVKVANGRNQISFDGTVARVESTFNVEMHHYLVDSELYLANAGEPSVPAALAGSVINVGHLHNFAPKPRAKVQPHLTSFVSGNHFLTPGDFAKIYGVDGLYTAGFDGTGQKIAVIGQSTVNTTDLNHFRTAAGLPASTVTMTLVGGTGTRCTGDEGESDLDLEWAGGIAKGASITFLYAGLNTSAGDTCAGSRSSSVWDALTYAVQNNVAPFISTSYGFCEAGLGVAFGGLNGTVQTLAKQGQVQGQTIVAASGDAGAADCDSGTSATKGLAVDVPAAIPEVTGAGGNEFVGDAAGTVTGTPPNTTAGSTPYWGASGAGSDTLVTALGYIPEEGWNDTALSISNGGGLSATGGGASDFAHGFFAKPTWQTGTGVPNDGARDVPDVSVSASPDHDGYLFCTEDDGSGNIVSTCTSGFRTGSGGSFTVVGGTSASAPTFAAILALTNQYIGSSGLAPVNPTLYGLADKAGVFHDVTSGDNKVPCTTGTPNCPSGTTTIGFTAGTGYDQVTGLGSVDAFNLAQAMSTLPGFSLSSSAPSYQVVQGSPVTATINLTPINGFTGQVTYTCTDPAPESTCTGPTGPVDAAQSASFTITTKAPVAKLDRPMDRGSRILYASLFPGLLGMVFVAASSKRSMRGVRLLGLVLALGFSTMWLGSCGGSSSNSNKDPGTPAGSYTITVQGASTVNGSAVTRQTTFQLLVQ